MARRILMTGKDAKYINIHGVNDKQESDRDILLTGDNAQYIEVTVGGHAKNTNEPKQLENIIND